MCQALLPQLCAEDALQKGEARYKQWSELREYLFLVGWVGADLPDGHPLQPDEAVTETVEEYLELLPKLSEALAKLDSNAETADKGAMRGAADGQSIVSSADEAPSGYDSDELPDELRLCLRTSLTSYNLLRRRRSSGSYAHGPLLLPCPWSFLDFKELGEDAKVTWALDVKMLMARNILQHQEGGTGTTDEAGLGCLHDMLEAA
eukprot:jgi/Tetstr1/420903/TSEL_011966.t1